jgi:RNA polymerase sigma-70 factor (ECF subfamily)
LNEKENIPENHKEELDIIEKCRKNPHEFAVLYNRYYKPIWLYIHKRTADETLSSDLTSQVFLKAMSGLSRYTYQGFGFSSWLYKIAVNEINEFYRRKKIRQLFSIEDHDMQRLKLAVEEDPDFSGESEIVLNCLKKLDPEDMQVIELRFFEDKSFKEIGFILNMTENNAKVRTYRVLDKLRKILMPVKK